MIQRGRAARHLTRPNAETFKHVHVLGWYALAIYTSMPLHMEDHL
jgi:hypothetical protein